MSGERREALRQLRADIRAKRYDAYRADDVMVLLDLYDALAAAEPPALDVERLANIILDGGLRLPDFDHWRESRSNKPSDPDDERWVCVCGVAGSPEFVQRHWAAMRAEYARLAREGSEPEAAP